MSTGRSGPSGRTSSRSDFTYVSTWRGWQYVAFVVAAFARRIVGWRVSSSTYTDFVFDALEQVSSSMKRGTSVETSAKVSQRADPVFPAQSHLRSPRDLARSDEIAA